MLRMARSRRTLPRVRELKHAACPLCLARLGRTLPRVRELKQGVQGERGERGEVAPFPGCVN